MADLAGKVPDAPGPGVRLDRKKLNRHAELFEEPGGYPYDRDPGHPHRYAPVPKQRFADPNSRPTVFLPLGLGDLRDGS